MTAVQVRENLNDGLIVRELTPDELRRLREERGLSLRRAAALAGYGLTGAALSRLELGERSPQLKTLEAITRAYGVRIVIKDDGVFIDNDGDGKPKRRRKKTTSASSQ